MNIWRLHVRPDHSLNYDPVQVCIKQNIIGIGWGVDKKPASKDEYWSLGKQKYGDTRWVKAANAIIYKMKQDDLVWFRSASGVYYLGRITADWEYKDDPENVNAGVVNIRKAEIYKAGTSIAGKIISSFRPRATLQKILGNTISDFSKVVFNKLCGKTVYSLKSGTPNIFQLLSDTDLEDVIGIFLQLKKKYIVVPSSRSRKNDTPFYEYQLISEENGHNAYVQVKSGNRTINLDNYVYFGDKFYLFSPAGYYGKGSENTIRIDVSEIEDFLKKNKQFLPFSITSWLDYAKI